MSSATPHVVHATECAASGTLNVIVCLARELADAGVRQTFVYATRPETPRDLAASFPPGVELIEVPAARGSHVEFVRGFHTALRFVVEQLRPDVLHLHSSKAGFVGRLARAWHRWPCRTLYSPHGLAFLDPDKRARNAVFGALEWLAARTGAEPVGCGRGEAELLARLSGRDAWLLENPVDEAFFDVARGHADAPTIVSLGRLSRQKAPEHFALVAHSVRTRVPGARFVWIGDGEPHYRALLSAAGCEVTGWCDRAAVMHHLARATVYLQTSRWEGLPISVIQALAAGVPAVVNDCIGNRDAVTHGVTGFVAGTPLALSDAVLRLLGDATLRATLGATARLEARRRFGRAAFRAQLRALYGIAEPARADVAAPLPEAAHAV